MFLGQARMFRQRVAASEVAIEALVPKLWRQVHQHVLRHRNPPKGVAGIWQRQMPAAGTLSLMIESKRAALRIVEDRALETAMRGLDAPSMPDSSSAFIASPPQPSWRPLARMSRSDPGRSMVH